MFGKKSARNQMSLANVLQGQANQAFTNASAPDPLFEAWKKSGKDFLDWENSSGKSIDSAPGMSPSLSLYDNAIRDGADDAGQGLIQMGADGVANPNLKTLIADRRQQRAAGELEDAYNRRHAEVTGMVMPAASLDASNRLSLASMASGNANNAWARALAQSVQSGFTNSNLFNQMMGGARTALGGYFGLAAARAGAGYADGGRYAPFRKFMVGERAPELKITDDGDASLVGLDGPEIRVENKPGVIVPLDTATPPKMPPPVLRSSPLSDTMPRTTAALSMLESLKGSGASAPLSTAVNLPVPDTSSLPPTTSNLAPLILRPVVTSSVVDDDGPASRPRSVDALPPPMRPNQPITYDAPALGTSVAPKLPIPTLEERAGVDTSGVEASRRRIYDPTSYHANRITEIQGETPRDHNGRAKSALLGALRGFAAGGLGGALYGAASHAIDPSLDEAFAQRQNLAHEQGALDQVLHNREDVAKVRLGEANADYMANVRPEVALGGLDVKRDALTEKSLYDNWRMRSGDRKQDTADSYIAWRKLNGDRRADTADGRLELDREWRTQIQPQQFDRRMSETERHNDVTETQGARRLDQGEERNAISRDRAAAGAGKGGAVADVYEGDAQRAEKEADDAEQQFGPDSQTAKRAKQRAQQARTRANLARARAGGITPPALRAPAAASGARVSRARARELYPELKSKSDAEVDAAIRASGREPIP